MVVRDEEKNTEFSISLPVLIGLAWLAGLIYLLILQPSSFLHNVSSEHQFPEVFSRVFVLIALLISLVWSIHQYRTDEFKTLTSPLNEGLTFYLTLSFFALFLFENNWDLDLRESLAGRIITGMILLPLFLIPVVWYNEKIKMDPTWTNKWDLKKTEVRCLLLSVSSLGLLGFSQVLDYNHDHHIDGSGLISYLGGIRGFEECLEYWALLGILMSFYCLAMRREAVVRDLVRGSQWRIFLALITILSIGNAMLQGEDWDDWLKPFHLSGLVIMVVSTIVLLQQLMVFVKRNPEMSRLDDK